jgi:hypothetical protein
MERSRVSAAVKPAGSSHPHGEAGVKPFVDTDREVGPAPPRQADQDEAPAGAQGAAAFLQYPRQFRRVEELQGEGHEDGVESTALAGQVGGVAHQQVNPSRKPGLTKPRARLLQHAAGKVQPAGLAVAAHRPGQFHQGAPGAAADLQHAFAGPGIQQPQTLLNVAALTRG